MSGPEQVPITPSRLPFYKMGTKLVIGGIIVKTSRCDRVMGLGNARSVGVQNGPSGAPMGLLYHSSASALPSSGDTWGQKICLFIPPGFSGKVMLWASYSVASSC